MDDVELLYKLRKATVDLGFDPDWVREELDKEEWTDGWQVDQWQEARGIFLGTCFALCPSGKYYQPFACSNVELCPVCHGHGTISRGKLYDTVYKILWHLRDNLVDSIKNRNHAKLTIEVATIFYKATRVFEQPQCLRCFGVGSEEAFEDQLWWEKADDLYESHGFLVESGEGDPCDILAVEYRDKEDVS